MTTALLRYRFGRFDVRPAERRLLVDGRVATLGARAFDLLVVLLEQRHRVVAAGELFELVWPGVVVEENNLRQQIAALRKVLGAAAVVTVPGRGYRFTLSLDAQDVDPLPSPGMAAAAGRAGAANNLPLNLPVLIGRERELAAVTDCLGNAHLLTLVGAGGVGKTRLALQVAGQVMDRYRHGVWFVELAPIVEGALVAQEVARALDVHEEAGRPLTDTVRDFLRHRELLILLDNCEHLVEACARWAEDVLHSSAATRILATSREALGIAGEVKWPVPSLRTAAPASDSSPEQLMAYPATQLFVQRAVEAAPTFQLTPENAPAVSRLCHELDGIPLALELAAARVRAMRVEQVAERLSDRFALLTRGSRTALPRHQTLCALIEWSHDLLSEAERVLLRRLSIFSGGWTIEAAEAVCGDAHLPAGKVLDLMTLLVEKSMVLPDDHSPEPRYRALETIRQFAFEKLSTSGELEVIGTRHLRYLVDFAEGIRTELTSRDQVRWHGQVEMELDNIRVALNRSLRRGNVELGLRVMNALHRFWYKMMLWKEIVDWQERLAACCEREGLAPTLHLARSMYVAGMLASNFDLQMSRRFCISCLSLSRSLAFAEGTAWALVWLGHIDIHKHDPKTAELFAEGMRVGRHIEDPHMGAYLRGNCLLFYANYEAVMCRNESAEAMVGECEKEFAQSGSDPLYLGHCRVLLATMARRRGQLARAGEHLAEAMALYRSVDSNFDIAACLTQQAFLALSQGEPGRAFQIVRQALPFVRHSPQSALVTKCLAFLVIARAGSEMWGPAAQLAGALGSGDAPLTATPRELSGRIAQAYEEAIASTRAAMGELAFMSEGYEGRCMTRDQAIELVLACKEADAADLVR
jgi:non-specific serine/threonine protein kinase